MLAAAVTMRVVREHVASVLDHRRLVGPIELHLVRRGQIVQRLEVRRHRTRQRVERDILAPVRPERIAGDARHPGAEYGIDNVL